MAVADLHQPVRLTKTEGNGYIFRTNKGESTPAGLTRQTEEEMQLFTEELLLYIDKHVSTPLDKRDNRIDTIKTDQLTAPPWFGQYTHIGSFYAIEGYMFFIGP